MAYFLCGIFTGLLFAFCFMALFVWSYGEGWKHGQQFPEMDLDNDSESLLKTFDDIIARENENLEPECVYCNDDGNSCFSCNPNPGAL